MFVCIKRSLKDNTIIESKLVDDFWAKVIKNHGLYGYAKLINYGENSFSVVYHDRGYKLTLTREENNHEKS